MTQIGEILGVLLQGSRVAERKRGARRTTLLEEFLREKMNGLDRVEGRRKKSLKERLECKGLGCCGAIWGFRPSTVIVQDEEAQQLGPQVEQSEVTEVGQTARTSDFSNQNCVAQIPATQSMNLATALAAERHYRAAQDTDGSVTGGAAPETPSRVSLMRLLEEETTDGWEVEKGERGGGEVVGSDSMCCVCMGRKKGAAFVPCGHTFCRVCSRELRFNRGACPLCNTPILQILDIF